MLTENMIKTLEGNEIEAVDLILKGGKTIRLADGFLLGALGEHDCVTIGVNLKITDVYNVAASILSRIEAAGTLPMFWGTYTMTHNLTVTGEDKEADNESGQD